jgi:peptidoglycan/xylan/chitin deacetylase (PgdA/CDA1 family)
LRKIFGPTKELNGLWRNETNEELDELIRFIKSQRLKWLGHVERMPKEREVTRNYKWKSFALDQ